MQVAPRYVSDAKQIQEAAPERFAEVTDLAPLFRDLFRALTILAKAL